jgi:large subunit ribosomal protein L25
VEVTLQAQEREKLGTGESRQARREGFIPAVLYGGKKDVKHLRVDLKEVEKILSHYTNPIISLQVGGETQQVIIKDIQKDTLRRRVSHVDFLRVDMQKKITVSVPVHMEGDAKGIREGGILQFNLHEVEVECLPKDIPDAIHADITNLEIGESLTVASLNSPAGVEIKNDPEAVVASIVPPAKAEETGEMPEEESVAEEGISKKAVEGDKETQ